MFITEIFKSIQGEGTRAGRPCIFVRLTGCNLRCTWCDTTYAFHGGQKMSVEEVVERVEALRGSAVGGPLVELTMLMRGLGVDWKVFSHRLPPEATRSAPAGSSSTGSA